MTLVGWSLGGRCPILLAEFLERLGAPVSSITCLDARAQLPRFVDFSRVPSSSQTSNLFQRLHFGDAALKFRPSHLR